MLNIALPKGRLGESVYQLFADAGYPCPALLEKSRKLTFENPEAGVRYFWVKPSDVAVYVERGAADIGVAGKDILLEYKPDVYELADLDVGKCRMAVAGFPDAPVSQTLRVATKFPNIAKAYYTSERPRIGAISMEPFKWIMSICRPLDAIICIIISIIRLPDKC